MKLSKSFFARLFWFVVGAVLSLWINAGLFGLFNSTFGWNRYVAYALSLTIVNVILFLWNYVVGFKTDRHWTDAAWRQVVCLGLANGLNYGLVMVLQGMFPRWPEIFVSTVAAHAPQVVRALPDWPKTIIAGVQVFIAPFKFVLYHYWVYLEPIPTELAPAEAGQVS